MSIAGIVVNGGQKIPAGRMIGNPPSQAEPKYVGWGTGAGTTAAANTTLFSEKALDLSSTSGTRVTGSSSLVTTSQTNDTYQVTATLTATGSGTVTNVGLFDNATIGSGTLYMKSVTFSQAMVATDVIALTVTVQMT